MSIDPNKKTARTFQCRDSLWAAFGELARNLDCSVDYLINEGMRHYARQHREGALSRPRLTEPVVGSSATEASSLPPARVAPAPPPLPPPPTRTIALPSLSIVYMGEKVPVAKDRFIIGRGKQSCDLLVADPNVSRQHAVVEFHDGRHIIYDMGSTNGVEFNGGRVERKVIGEGDVVRICDHELAFTYR